MLSIEKRTTELSADDYIFLNENFEIADKSEIAKGVSYIVFNRKRNITKIVKSVLQNELDALDRNIALDYWGNGLNANQIAQKYNLSQAKIYRTLKSVKTKVETYLKYVLLYDEYVHRYSVSELMSFIKGEFFEN